MSKKGIHSYVVLYVLVAVIGVMVLYFGYGAIQDFKERGKTGQLLEFKTWIEGSINNIASQNGNMRQETFIAPAGVKEVCFVDLDADYIDINNSYTLIIDSVESGARKNMFILGKEIFDSYDVGPITIDNPRAFTCIPVENGKIKIRMLGEGIGTKIMS
ncbi:hypothetical protein D6745_02035 [Candidatus Woesearchaeota archaeon]|nr:MAG: hypothetical protein D6745_02035 [Candidatus Woesearchaeota archaeon]